MNPRGFLARAVLALFAAVALLGAALGWFQGKMDRGRFEFGQLRQYVGTLNATPLPMLRTAERSYFLVGDGKFGAASWATEWAQKSAGRSVRIAGTLIEREPIAMLEINREEPPEILDQPGVGPPLTENLGPADLTGELVDSKCFLGVMRPAAGKVHRGCAVRCLSGGVPPGILLRLDPVDSSVLVLISGTSEQALPISPQWAGRLVHARGRLELHGGLPVLRASFLELAGGSVDSPGFPSR